MSEPKVQMNFRLSPELADALKARAASDNITATQLLEKAISSYLGIEPKNNEIEALLASKLDSYLQPLNEKIQAMEAALGESRA